MMIIAVGSGERIGQVLPELGGLLREPLITLERVRVCKRDGELLATPHELPGTDEHGLALWQKLMIHTSQAATHNGHSLNLEIIRRLRESDAAGATSLRGIWGFHGDHAPHGDKFFQIRRHVPVVTIVIDTPERIARSFEIIDELTSEHGLVTSEMVPAMTAMTRSRTTRRPAARQARLLTRRAVVSRRHRRDTRPVAASAAVLADCDGGAAGVAGVLAELLLDSHQLVVLRAAFATGRRPGLDLSRFGGDDEVGDERVVGFA